MLRAPLGDPAVDLPRIDPATATDEQLRAFVRSLAEDAALRRAVCVATPAARAAMDRVDELSTKRLRRLATTLAQYSLRLSQRPTPFGLFAGVAVAEPGPHASFRWGADHRADAHLDHDWWQQARAAGHMGEPALLVANPLVVERADRTVVPWPTAPDAERQVSVGTSPLLRVVLDAAERPRSRADLVDVIRAAVPEADDDRADAFIAQLQANELLLEVAGEPAVEAAGAELASAVVALEQVDGDFERRWAVADERARAALPGHDEPFHVDALLDVEVALPSSVADDVADAARTLWGLSPDTDGQPALAAYHRLFLNQYGTDRLVPLTELLDDHLGLGFPAGYEQPPSLHGRAPEPTCHDLARDAVLGEMAWGCGELDLTDDAVAALTPSGSQDAVPPSSFDVGVTLHATDAASLDRGEYLLTCAQGSMQGGAVIGRFASALGVTDQLRWLWERGQADVVAELVTRTVRPRMANVTPYVGALGARLPIGVGDDRGDPGVVDVRDLVVGSTGERLYLADRRRRATIDVVRGNMLNAVTGLPNVARFVAALGLGGRRFWTSWDWGRLAVQPHLPRVVRGRVVLAPEQWRAPVLPETGCTADDLARSVGHWQEQRAVPDVIRVQSADHVLELDLRHPVHRRLLQRHTLREPDSVVTETPARAARAHGVDAPYGFSGGRPIEVVMPVVTGADEPVAPGVPWHRADTAHPRTPPGGEWLSVRLYLEPWAEESFLTTQLPRLLDELAPETDWYFVRYADPRHHLRLRVRTVPGDWAVAAVVSRWAEAWSDAGLIRTSVLDVYAPEVARYGGPAGMAAAERLFAIDSRVVVHLLRTVGPQDWLGRRVVLGAATCLHLVEAALADDAEQVVQALPADLTHAVPGALRREARALVFERSLGESDPALQALLLRRADAARELALAAGSTQHAAGPVMSAVHLHCNRLLTTDPELEKIAHGLMRAVVVAEVGRRRHGS